MKLPAGSIVFVGPRRGVVVKARGAGRWLVDFDGEREIVFEDEIETLAVDAPRSFDEASAGEGARRLQSFGIAPVGGDWMRPRDE